MCSSRSRPERSSHRARHSVRMSRSKTSCSTLKTSSAGQTFVMNKPFDLASRRSARGTKPSAAGLGETWTKNCGGKRKAATGIRLRRGDATLGQIPCQRFIPTRPYFELSGFDCGRRLPSAFYSSFNTTNSTRLMDEIEKTLADRATASNARSLGDREAAGQLVCVCPLE